MPSFLDKATESDKELRNAQEKDPADFSDTQEPDWDNPDSWSGDKSASENAGDPADGNDDQTPEPVTPPKAPSPSSTGRSRAPRRRGRPRGPERIPLTVRILEPTDRKLTAAVEQTGLNPQTLVEEALEAYFRRLKIQDPGAETRSEGAA
ncbi:hypothetical protein G3M53_91515 [Streptomyces sp. SID7982]|uniref:hypothetical protein n=1 Tax=Streptomyces sp. SID5614 TaxID=2690306 RepID=UPI00136A5EB5|nr:hypothetical protein [Streptomyces sp. SID5614]MZG06198.1 hypothetical protein [Streptomyces sp. SID5614]NEE41586.1 hypothetical protein [Streptomyces sp. SID7982]